MRAVVVFVTSLCAALVANAAVDSGGRIEIRSMDFDVFLDDARIGYHHYEIHVDGTARTVRSKATFDVKVLFFTAFRYRHELEERWDGDCLVELDATTNSNGNRSAVAGERNDRSFVVETAGERAELPACVMTFAYWNPDFLDERRLLNPQTGRYVEIDVESLGQRTLNLAGGEFLANGYTVRAKDYEVTVWYSANDAAWLALESPARGGRTLRYELT